MDSLMAYVAAIYVRSINSSNQIKVQLLCSKSKVSPILKKTLARLELCAAVLLSKLIHKLLSVTINC